MSRKKFLIEIFDECKKFAPQVLIFLIIYILFSNNIKTKIRKLKAQKKKRIKNDREVPVIQNFHANKIFQV
ncbi:hypothetical protein BpHYR1_027274 [Brachionus plicatilis]|uniref:Uncharacterized protein n=1 Tax=Brachionus plicatilis TaxID=10195 RepID=A0A3M7RBS5_BRAPC|nr:hypothetical protein BpHYR1_027274 [Brachionus plicatilis]